MRALITPQDLDDLCKAAAIAGFEVDVNKLTLETWEAGEGHQPRPLPQRHGAVYVFVRDGQCLKVGKVNARSNPRYQFQHYRPDSCRSNLALSLLGDAEFCASIGNRDVGEWMRQNTTRYNILIPAEVGERFVHFAEAFFILKYRPTFESG